MNLKLKKLDEALKNTHKRFLELEKMHAEEYFQRKIGPFEFVTMLVQDKGFEWLRPFSVLIADIDAFADTSEEITNADLICIKQKINGLINDQESSIKKRYQFHLLNDPTFVMFHSHLKKEIS